MCITCLYYICYMHIIYYMSLHIMKIQACRKITEECSQKDHIEVALKLGRENQVVIPEHLVTWAENM